MEQNSSEKGRVEWHSPSNIALIKYWGKHGNQLPNNASVSMTLNDALTLTGMQYEKTGNFHLEYFFEHRRNAQFEKKVNNFLAKLNDEMPFLKDYNLKFQSENTFPHSTGIASSASAMSSIALCLVSLENVLKGKEKTDSKFFQRASEIARLGSGSASRSVFGQWVTWGEISEMKETSDTHASPLIMPMHEKFQVMGDAVLIVCSKSKKVSSSLGHNLMNVHPFAKSRYKQASQNMQALLMSMQVGDFESFATIVENEALTLHSLLMTSSPDGLLLKPGTLEIIEAIREYRRESGVELCFTIDAGPNVHLLYPVSEKKKVHGFIEGHLLRYCENEQWIDDRTGNGPVAI